MAIYLHLNSDIRLLSTGKGCLDGHARATICSFRELKLDIASSTDSIRIVVCWVLIAIIICLSKLQFARWSPPDRVRLHGSFFFSFHVNCFPFFLSVIGWDMVAGLISLYISSCLFLHVCYFLFMGWRNMAGSGLLSNGTAVIGIQVYLFDLALCDCSLVGEA